MTAVIDHYRDDDAAALAAMWNESNDQWPGGFNAGPPFNAARMREWIAAQTALARLVARADGRIVGYCDLAPDGPEGVFIPLLNVHPAYQGRGIGRDLLRRAVAEAAALPTCRRLRLRTWPANAGALLLYKKVGFFWEPGTAVEMVNFLPALLRHPLAADYFHRHDWYRTQRPRLSAAEDGELWHGLAVYAYRFEDGEDWLTAIIDRSAGCISAVETPHRCVQGWRARSVGAPGTCMKIFVAARAERGQALQLEASAGDGLAFVRPLPHTVDGRAGAPVEATVRLSPEVAAARPRTPVVRAVAEADGERTWVEIALPVAVPVRFELAGEPVIPVGAQRRLNVRVFNQLPEPLTAQVCIAAGNGLKLCGPDGGTLGPFNLRLPAGGVDGCDVLATANVPGGHALRLQAAVRLAGGRCTVRRTLPLLAPEAGNAVAAVGDAEAWLAGDFLLVKATPAGDLTLVDRLSGRPAARIDGISIGPPFSGQTEAGAPVDWAARRLTAGGGEMLELAWTNADGLAVTRLISIAGPVTTVRDRLTNGGSRALIDRRCRTAVWTLLRGAQLCVPLAEGLTTAPMVAGEYPLGQDYEESPHLLGEQWVAAWDSVGAVGVIFGGRPATALWSRCLVQLTRGPFALAPGESLELPPIRVYVGPGDWRSVRSLWAAGEKAEGAVGTQPEPLMSVTLSPRPVFAGDAGLVLRLENRRASERDGEVRLLSPAGWVAEPDRISVDAVARGRERVMPVALGPRRGDAEAGAAAVELAWTSAHEEVRTAQPVFVVERPGTVRVTRGDDGEWLIDNGRLAAVVAPHFAGSMRTLRDSGRELLASPYPTAGAFVDLAPWYGGLHPQMRRGAGDWPGCGHRAVYAAEAVVLTGARGKSWRGVRLTVGECTGQHGSTSLEASVRRQLDLLTLPSSNLLAVVARVCNDSGADLELWFGFDAYPLRPPGATLKFLPAGAAAGEAPRARRAGAGLATLHGLAWLSVDADPACAAGPALAIISPEGLLRVDDYGERGLLASTVAAWRVPARGIAERLTFLASAGSAAEALLYKEFCALAALP